MSEVLYILHCCGINHVKHLQLFTLSSFVCLVQITIPCLFSELFLCECIKKKKKKKGTSTIYYTSYIMQNEFNFVFNLIANYEQYT